MGSTNAILKYKNEDIYSDYGIKHGIYDKEIKTMDIPFETKKGIETFHYRIILPKRPFCLMSSFSVIEGGEDCCIVEFKHAFNLNKQEIVETHPCWIITKIPDVNKPKLISTLIL